MKRLLFTLVASSLLAFIPLQALSKDRPDEVVVSNFPAVQTVDGTVSVDNFPESQEVNGTIEVSNLPVDADGRVVVTGRDAALPEIYAYMTDVQVAPGARELTKQVSVPAGKRLVIEQIGVTGTAPDYPAPHNGEFTLDLGPSSDVSRPHFRFVIERIRTVGSGHLIHVAPQRVSFMLDGPRTFQLRVERDQTFGWYITWINLYGYLIDLPD